MITKRPTFEYRADYDGLTVHDEGDTVSFNRDGHFFLRMKKEDLIEVAEHLKLSVVKSPGPGKP